MNKKYQPLPKDIEKLLGLITEVYQLGVCQGLVLLEPDYNEDRLIDSVNVVMARTWNNIGWRGRLVLHLAEEYGTVEEAGE